MKKNNNIQGNQHSFYKEAHKSILGQQELTPKKIFGSLKKILKICFWLFLIIITLWGCVNNFILKTSKNLGQGVEFYQTNDFVYPNMYQAEKFIGYTASNKEVDSGIKEKDIKTVPFDFGVINPNFASNYTINNESLKNSDLGKKFEEQKEKIIVPSDEVLKLDVRNNEIINIQEESKIFSYNLNQLTTNYSGLSNIYRVDDLLALGNFVDTNTLPKTLLDEVNDDLENNLNDNKYKVGNAKDLFFYFEDKKDNLNGIIDNIDDSEFITKKDDNGNSITTNVSHKDVIGINFVAKPIDSISSISALKNESNWQKIKFIKNKNDDEDIEGLISFLRSYTFSSGDLTGNTTKIFMESSSGKEIIEAYGVSELDADNLKIDLLNNIKAKETKDELTGEINPGVVYGGSQIIVIPIKKGYPIQASDETKELITGENYSSNIDVENDFYRDPNFEHKETTNGFGYDTTIQNYGWMLMDSKINNDGTHDILRTYSDAKNALNSSTIAEEKIVEKENAFYGDIRREGWGQGEEIFDEKIKQMMNSNLNGNLNDDYFVPIDETIKINGEDYSYKLASKFAGMTSTQEVQKIDKTYQGTIPRLEDGVERSILSDSVIPTKQDSWGETRISFIGIEDWNKAFEVKYGPLYGFVIFPLAQISMGIGEWFNYLSSPWGTLGSIALIVFLTRGLGTLLSLKGTKNQMKMQEVQTEVAKIKSRYSKYDLKKDKKMKQKQQQEIMALYRKHEVNPMGSFGTIFTTMPIFISLWIIISSLPAYKLVIMGNFSWAITSWSGIFAGSWLLLLYLLVGVTVGLIQGISSKLPTWLANKRKGIKRVDEATKLAAKKQNKTQNIMVGVFIFMGLTVPALFGFYWIMSGLFAILLELSRHGWKQMQAKRIKEGKQKISFRNNIIKPLFKK